MIKEDLKDMTNDIAELKATIRQVINKYDIKYLGIDIIEEGVTIDGKVAKDITLSIEI